LAVPAAPAVTVCVPLAARAPLQAPAAAQPAAGGLLTLQVKVTTWPLVVAVGVALMLTTGVAAVSLVVAVAVVAAAALLPPPPPPQAVNARQDRAQARAAIQAAEWGGRAMRMS
jgi:hypothetical protein